LLDKFIPDADEKAKLAHEIATMAQKQAHESAIAQVKVNEKEAQHRSIFIAGWRPFVGWTCGIALFYHFIVQPVLMFFMDKPAPSFDMSTLSTILMGMLGLGGLRTFEKYKSITK
jgi:hypothetical protein